MFTGYTSWYADVEHFRFNHDKIVKTINLEKAFETLSNGVTVTGEENAVDMGISTWYRYQTNCRVASILDFLRLAAVWTKLCILYSGNIR